MAKIVYVTDLEGNFARWRELTQNSGAFARGTDGSLLLNDGWDFVFGGDIIDRTPDELRLLADFVPFVEAHVGRAHVILGNRDVNKMSLRLVGPATPVAVARLRRNLDGLNARNLFEGHRRQLNAGASDHETYASLANLLRPDGYLYRYLAAGRLAHVADQTLFVHGAWRKTTAGDPLAAAVDRYNAWSSSEFRAWARRPSDGGGDLVRSSGDSDFLLYGHYSDAAWNPGWPAEEDIAAMKAGGVHRLVVGHRAYGQTPAILRRPDFEVIFADTSTCAECGVPIVEIDGAGTRVRSRLADGTAVDFTFRRGEDGPLGRWTRDGWLIVGRTAPGAWIGFRNPGNQNIVIAAEDLRLEEGGYVVRREITPLGEGAVDAALALENPRARVAAFEGWTGERLSPAQTRTLIAYAGRSENSFEIGQFIRLAGESRAAEWRPQLDAWITAWRPFTRGWQTFLRASAEAARSKLDCEARFTSNASRE